MTSTTLASLEQAGPAVVLPVGDRFQVVGVDAGPVPTGVVDLQPLRHWAVSQLVGDDMGVSSTVLGVALVVQSTLPHPAATELLGVLPNVQVRKLPTALDH
jgi:hypothetical protein